MSVVNILSVSGGKDSTAMWLEAIERGVDVTVVFADTGHEHPLTYAYFDQLETRLGEIRRVRADFSKQIARKREIVQTNWVNEGVADSIIQNALAVLHPTGVPFLDLCIAKGRFPSSQARFCTSELKVKPITEHIVLPLLDDGHVVMSWQGVRRDESRARSTLPVMSYQGGGLYTYRPILFNTVEWVFAKHKKHGIAPNPLYKKGMGRVGCMPCIMANKSELKQIALRYPEECERVSEWERLVAAASKRGISTFFPSDRIPEGRKADRETLETTAIATIGRVAEWAKTSRGGKQYPILFDDPAPACQSVHGLCE